MKERMNEKDEEMDAEIMKRKQLEAKYKINVDLVSDLKADIDRLENENNEKKLKILTLSNDNKLLKARNIANESSPSSRTMILTHKLKCAHREIDDLKTQMNDQQTDENEK